MVNNFNKRIIKTEDILCTIEKIFELLQKIEEQITFYLNEIKIIYNNLDKDYNIESCLGKLKLLQNNFIMLIKIEFNKLKLIDGFYVYKLYITENTLNNTSDITTYFNNNLLDNNIFNNLHIHLNYNNYYIYNLPIFIFNIDPVTYSLTMCIYNNNEPFYYTLTPICVIPRVIINSMNDVVNEKNNIDYITNFFGLIINQDFDIYINKIKKIKNELKMITNITKIISI